MQLKARNYIPKRYLSGKTPRWVWYNCCQWRANSGL